MKNPWISRRSFVLAGMTLPAVALALPKVGDGRLTASGVIQRIRDNVGTAWLDKTVDRIIAGDGATPIHGIATTMMATLEVLQKAVAAGTNMVITHEPTFYSHEDATGELKPMRRCNTRLSSSARIIWLSSASMITGIDGTQMESRSG